MEDRDSERLTDVVDAMGDDALGMRIGHGTEVGGYIIDGEIGHGAMGVVYSATHPVIRKRAAIKILRLDVSQSPIAVERFIQEARAVNQIGHPNIIDIFAYGALPDGRAYHVMDLLAGESLRQRLKHGVLHPSEAASVIDEIASALMAAHDNGFVHRDLKPDNVFLVTREQRWPEVKLLDFGLAKLMPEYGVPAFRTKTGVMLGTPEYMSPEQARGQGVDYRTDVYALGIVMFEILAGSRPFPPLGEPVAVLMQHAEEPPLSLADTVPGLPGEMVQLVDAMLAKTPQARPSLAAVRTVIKRLRTTQLPTRSVAGMAMSSFSTLPARPDLAITASRVGAEAVLPEPRTASIRPITSPPPSTHGTSHPRAAPATSPPPSTHGRSAPATSPPPSTHGASPARSAPATSPLSTHGAAPARSAPATSPPPSTHGASPARSGTSPPSSHAASPARSAPATMPPSIQGASPAQPARAGGPAELPAAASAGPLDPRLPSALQRLAAASQSPSAAKPDITTRGVGVQSVWASQGGAPRFSPTPSPDVPRAPTGSQPPPMAPGPSATPAISPGQRAASSPGLPSAPAPSASSSASPSAAGGANPSTSGAPRSDRIGATLLGAPGAPGASTSRLPPTALGVGAPSRQAPATGATSSSRRRWLLIALLLVVIAGGALAVVLLGLW